MLLEIDSIDVYYGKIQALRDVSLRVNEGEMVAVLGANGAGKSTLLRTISGLLRPRAGDIRFNNQIIDGLPAEQIVRLGIAHVPEGRQIFANMTVAENLDMGAFTRRDPRGVSKDRDMVFHLFPRLKERSTQRAGTLSGGEQQMLAIARAIMSHPRLLLLDEPSIGVAPALARTITSKVLELNFERGLSTLIVEQNVRVAADVSSRAYVYENGKVVRECTSDELRDSELTIAYLGR